MPDDGRMGHQLFGTGTSRDIDFLEGKVENKKLSDIMTPFHTLYRDST